MGGHGSGWQGAKKATVESSLVLDAALLRRKAAGSRITGSRIWGASDAPSAIINYEADLTPGNAWIRLHYQRNGELLDYKIRLVSTRPTYGGLRWWFICPSRRADGGPRRVAKLYLPPGRKYFGSREGYGLTYRSCQESGKDRKFIAALVAETGMNAKAVRGALKRGEL